MKMLALSKYRVLLKLAVFLIIVLLSIVFLSIVFLIIVFLIIVFLIIVFLSISFELVYNIKSYQKYSISLGRCYCEVTKMSLKCLQFYKFCASTVSRMATFAFLRPIRSNYSVKNSCL